MPIGTVCSTDRITFLNQQLYLAVRLDGLQCMLRHYNYSLEESVYNRRTRQVTQLFTYLLTHKLFSSCIRQYFVSHACDWVMPALSAVLLTFSFQFGTLFCALTQFRVIFFDDLAVIWRRNQATVCTYVMPYRKRALNLAADVFLYAAYSLGESSWIDTNFKMNAIHTVGDHLAVSFRHL